MKIFAFALSIASSGFLLAAVPSGSALEVLSMSETKRLEIAGSRAKDFYPTLVNVAFSDEHSIPMRWKALTLAAQIDPSRAQFDLEKALKRKEWFLKNSALVALQKTRPEFAQAAALKLLKDKALVVRSAAVSVLDVNRDAKMRTVLWNELNADYNFRKGQSLWIRGQIVERLALFPEKHEYQAFGVALRSSDETLYAPAIYALEKITQKKFGAAKSSIYEKRNLWLDYVRKNPSLKL